MLLGDLAAAGLTDDEAALIRHHQTTITDRLVGNQLREAYYQGRQRVKQLGIALPETTAASIDTVVGWPEIAVDALEERLEFEGFVAADTSTADLGLDAIVERNRWLTEASQAHIDSLIYGVEFGAVSVGDPAAGEPEVLVTWEPPTRMTAEWSPRQRRLTSAASFSWDAKGERIVRVTLFVPDETIIVDRQPSGRWVVVDRQRHGLGRVPVVRFANRQRHGRQWGSSEITHAVMSYTDTAVRTVLGMEVAREFYSSPQRYALGIGEKAFVDEQGRPLSGWEALLGKVWGLGRDENGEIPEVGQFESASPAPYLEQVKGMASMFAASAGVPVTYLGFHTQNPPGGDGIRAAEARLVKRAERRQTTLGAAHVQLADLALRLLHDTPPEVQLAARFRDAATPTRAATADAVVKQVSAGILPAQSEVTWELLGYDAVTRRRLAADVRRARAQDTLAALRGAAATATQDPTVAELADRRGDLDSGL